MAKSPRKTLNERRLADTGDPRSESGRPTAGVRPAAGGKVGLSGELIRLAYLCQAGVLTDAEFEAAKARTLARFEVHPANDRDCITS